ncbi:hypothetical protein JCM10207_001676 [Rhodosporidiobolus poonsookiae]
MLTYSTRRVHCCGRDWQVPQVRRRRAVAPLPLDRRAALPGPTFSFPPSLEANVPSPTATCCSSAASIAENVPAVDLPLWRRWTVTLLSVTLTFLVSSVSTSYSSSSKALEEYLHTSSTLVNLGLVTYVLGCALAPMVLAPCSEVFGRYRILVGSAIVWTISLLPQALAPHISVVIVFRFVAGCAAAGGSTLVGGTVADLWPAEQRGLPMALFTLFAFLGTGAGPAYGGVVVERLGWRWLSWFQLVLCSVFTVVFSLATEETRVVESAFRLPYNELGSLTLRTSSRKTQEPLLRLIKGCIARPCKLLLHEPIVLAFSTWVGFSWVSPLQSPPNQQLTLLSRVSGIMYLSLEAVTAVLEEKYSFSVTQAGLAFLCASSGGVLAFALVFPQNRFYRKHHARLGPEARLPIALLGSLLLPGGITLFAFSQGRTHVAVSLVGVVLFFSGISMTYSAATTYLADAFESHASSALAAVSLLRNLGGTAFPLFCPALYNALGYQWASFAAACAGFLLAVIPWVLLFRGNRLRKAGQPV